MVTGGSTGAVGGRVVPDFDDRVVDVWVGYICLGPVLVVLVGEAGLRLPDGTATGGLATSFGPPWTSLEAPGWAGGGTEDGTAAGSLAAGFGSPLTAPGAHGLFPLVLFLLLSPYISVTVPRLPPKATRNSVSGPKVANIAPKVGEGGGGEREIQSRFLASWYLGAYYLWNGRVGFLGRFINAKMGDSTLHAGILARWFEMLLLLLF